VSGIEAVGEAVTGGMAARAVEPHAGEPQGHGSVCLNCGTGLIGDFCHRCGQQGHVHRSLGAFWHDLSHSVLHFEGKIWRTLPLLTFRPGELTRRYIAGERARFLSPMALFLFSVFLMFALFSFVIGSAALTGRTGTNFESGMQEAIREAGDSIKELEEDRGDAVRQRNAAKVAEIDKELATMRGELSLLKEMQSKGVTQATISRTSDDLSGAPAWFQAAYNKAKANPSLLIYKLQNNAYKFSWLLIPISVPFVWLLFPFSRRFHLYDHTVFVTYSLCFMTLLAVVLSLLRAAGVSTGWLLLAAFAVPPIHMYKQLKGAYRLSRWGTAWRLILLLHFTTFTTALFLLMLLGLGVLG
jgi:hypothetical protein